jgi:outer membrane protein
MKRVFFAGLLLAASAQVHAAHDLVSVWRLAQAHDAQLAQARAEYDAQLKQIDRARAALLPQVTLQGSLSKSDTDLPNAAGDVRTRQMSLQAQQALYNRKALVAYDIAKTQLSAAEAAWRQARQDLITRVVKAYFDVLLAQANVKLAKSQEAANRTQWERAQTSEQVGLASRTDVLQARSAYDLSRAERIKADNALNTAYENLAKLTGQRVTALKSVNSRPPHLLAGDDQAWIQRALRDSPQLAQVARQRDAAEQTVDLERSDYYPTLALTAQVQDTAYDDYRSLYASTYRDTRASSLALVLNWPIYSGGLTRATVAQAQDNARKAREGLRDVREQLQLQVRVLLADIRNGESLVDALQAAVASSDAFLEAAEESYRVGLKSLLDVLTARANAHKARRDLVAALDDLVVRRLQLEAVVGDLDEEDLKRMDALLIDPDS